MDDILKKELNQEVPSDIHQKLLSSTLGLIQISRSYMSRYYDDWDRSAAIYRGEMMPDLEDVDAHKRREPSKMVVPLSFAQVQSFIAFCFLLLTQNQKFFEVEPNNDDDFKIRDDIEKFLKRDLARNNWSALLYQFLLDASRFNLGIIKSRWDEKYQYVATEQLVGDFKFGSIPVKEGKLETVMQKVLAFEGNHLMSVSPYRWYPDVRLPLTRFQEGEFCASDDEFSLTELKHMESSGIVSGVEWIPNAQISDDNPDAITGVGDDARLNQPARFMFMGLKAGKDPDVQKTGSVILTECQRWIIPSKIMIEHDKPLGPEDYPVLYVIWIANYQRVIRCEPMNYLHNKFTYDMGQFAPDIHRTLGPSLSGIIDQMQSIVSWFINSRVLSVRKSLQGKFVVDPSAIDTKTTDSRFPFIYLKKNFAGSGVDKWIKQLETQDVTAGHMADADTLSKMIQVVTGVNDNAMGQYNSGRRSATEARAVTSGAASRLKTVVAVMWSTAFGPLGQKLLTNLRQGISESTWMRVIGKPPQDPMQQALYSERYALFKGTPEELVGGDDFFLFDATLPSEKGFIAQSLQEMVSAAMANPETMMFLQDPNNPIGKLFKEIMELRGVTNFARFLQQPTAQPGAQMGQPQIPGQQPSSAAAARPAGTNPVAANRYSALNMFG